MNPNCSKILVVDDIDTNRFILRDIIHDMGHQPILAENGEQALQVAGRFPVDLIILDVAMPVMDGYECCTHLKENVNTKEIPIIFISAFDEPSDIVKGFELGGTDYITKPFIPEVVKARVEMLLRLSTATKNIQDMNHKLQMSLKEQLDHIEREQRKVLYALNRVARENAAYDMQHMERLSKNCRTLSEAMQLSVQYEQIITDHFIDIIELAAPLCDIGNVSIPTDILQKSDYLEEEEKSVMYTHTTVGAQILTDIEENGDHNEFISMSQEIARCHHENWDGSGYPKGWSGNEIPLSAQIVAVAGAFCSLTEKRTYREAYSPEKALLIMQKDSGIKFNPDIISIIQKISRQLV